MEKELGRKLPLEEVKDKLKNNFAKVFKASLKSSAHLSAESAI
jgi:hypothetical protein